MDVTWKLADPTGVADAFPHPLLASFVLLATDKGVLISEDAGKTFRPLEAASIGKVGAVRAVAFVPDRPAAFYLAGDRGLWATTDAGQTFTALATKARGLAADRVTGVWVYPGDPAFRTLLAAHGDAAPGVSVSYDSGAAWRVLWPEFFVRQVVCGQTLSHNRDGGKSLVLIAARKATPDLWSVFVAGSPGEPLEEEMRDLVPADAACALWGNGPAHDHNSRTDVYIATADSGLQCLGVGWGVVPARVGPATLDSWASVGVTWGPVPGTQMVYAYEPGKLGLVLSLDGLQTFTGHARGLPTGPFIKEGARIRAASSGATFYATVNGSLYIGTLAAPGLAIGAVTLSPPVASFSRDAYLKAREQMRQEIALLPSERSAAGAARRLRELVRAGGSAFGDQPLTVTARVTAPPGSPPPTVTVDLSPIGGAEQEPMLDDGQHGDGAAGDGVYGAAFRLDLGPNRRHTPRERGPGLVGLTITASRSGGGGPIAGASAALALLERQEDVVIFDEPREVGPIPTAGGASAEVVLGNDALSGQRALCIAATGGPWSAVIRKGGEPVGLSGYEALSFWVRADGAAPDELYVQLQDGPAFTAPVRTARVAVSANGLVRGGALGPQWRQVVVPLAKLLQDSAGFQPTLFADVVLSAEGKSAGAYWVDAVRLVRAAESK